MRATLHKPLLGCCLALVTLLAGCDLEQDITLELPPYTPQPAIEAYLTPGKPFTLLLTRSAGFFDPFPEERGEFLESTLLDSAEVTVRYGERVLELRNTLGFDPGTAQVFNYANPALVPADFPDSIYLDVRFPDGTEAYAATKLLPAVPIDSNVVEFQEQYGPGDDTLARILTYVTDPDTTVTNHFRKILTYSPFDSTVLQDFVINDDLSDLALFSTSTFYDFPPGDTLYVYNAHVDGDFNRYLTSVQTAIASNGNPFAQPSTILGNVRGDANALGIFTTYAYVVDTVIIPAF